MNDVIVFGAPGCPACVQAKNYLKSKNITFTYVSVGEDVTPQEFVESTGSQSVPVIVIDGEKHIGWNQALFD